MFRFTATSFAVSLVLCRALQPAAGYHRRPRPTAMAFPAKRESGPRDGRIPADGEGKIVKFRASFSEDQERDLD